MADITTAGLWMFILQGVSSLLMLVLGVLLKSMLTAVREVRDDLKALNDVVLAEYAPRKEVDRLRVDLDSIAASLRDGVSRVSDRVARIEGNRHVE